MKKNFILNENNVLLYAAKHYTNTNCYGTAEFYEDYKRLIYLKRIFIKYTKTGEIKENLVYNHLTILYNVFDDSAITKILFLKLKDFLSILKPYLILLGKLPDIIIDVNNNIIYTSDIIMDINIINKLRELKRNAKN